LNKILKRLNLNAECQKSLTFKADIHTALMPNIVNNLKAEAYTIDIS